MIIGEYPLWGSTLLINSFLLIIFQLKKIDVNSWYEDICWGLIGTWVNTILYCAPTSRFHGWPCWIDVFNDLTWLKAACIFHTFSRRYRGIRLLTLAFPYCLAIIFVIIIFILYNFIVFIILLMLIWECNLIFTFGLFLTCTIPSLRFRILRDVWMIPSKDFSLISLLSYKLNASFFIHLIQEIMWSDRGIVHHSFKGVLGLMINLLF